MQKQLKIIGTIAIIIGIVSSVLAINPYFLIFALPLSIIGIITSVIYIFIDTKYQVNTNKTTPGVIGIILNSIPVLIVLSIIIYAKLSN